MVVSQVRLFPRLLGRPGYTDRAWRHWHTLRRAARQVQDLLICIEMFLAAGVHQTVFSYRDFAKTCGQGGPCPRWPASRIAAPPRYAGRTSLTCRHGLGFCAKQRGSDGLRAAARRMQTRTGCRSGRPQARAWRETAQLLGANVGPRKAMPCCGCAVQADGRGLGFGLLSILAVLRDRCDVRCKRRHA